MVRTNIVLSKEIHEKLRQAAFTSRRSMSDLVREAVEKQLPTVTPPLSLEDIRTKAVPILQAAGVSKAALFGSYARGDNRLDSDIDILIEPPEHFTLFRLSGLSLDLEEALGKDVDVVTYKGIKPTIRDSILANQIQLL